MNANEEQDINRVEYALQTYQRLGGPRDRPFTARELAEVAVRALRDSRTPSSLDAMPPEVGDGQPAFGTALLG